MNILNAQKHLDHNPAIVTQAAADAPLLALALQQLERFDALCLLMASVSQLDNLPALAKHVAQQWHGFSTASAFHLIIPAPGAYLQIECVHGAASVHAIEVLTDWDAALWDAPQPVQTRTRPGELLLGLPTVLQDASATEILTLPLRRGDQLQGVLSVASGEAGFSSVDRKLIGFFAGHLAQHIQTILRRQTTADTLQRQTTIDSLTGALNRTAILDKVDKQLALSANYGVPASVVLLEVDAFAAINDTYGHQVGDSVLCEVVRRFGMQCRTSEHFGRYGGKQFLFVLYPCAAEDAVQVGERLRLGIADAAFVVRSAGTSVQLAVTISLGVCSTAGTQGLTAEDVVQRADDALYLSKHQGYNRVSLYATNQPPKPADLQG